jgi:hypothetical protein
MRKKIRQPFKYGIYLIEYREGKDGLLKILKEKLDTFEDAQAARERLLLTGVDDPIIRKVG